MFEIELKNVPDGCSTHPVSTILPLTARLSAVFSFQFSVGSRREAIQPTIFRIGPVKAEDWTEKSRCAHSHKSIRDTHVVAARPTRDLMTLDDVKTMS